MNQAFVFPTILLAPNAFKESLSAIKVATSLAKGLNRVIPYENILLLPVADGGDGSLEVLDQVLGLQQKIYDTIDPLKRDIRANISYSSQNEAFIEMASASGLHLLGDNEKNASLADSYGTGMLINCAFKAQAKSINLFVGGTASMDCGTGILRALGFKFLDKDKKEVPAGGIHLEKIHSVQLPDPKLLRHIQSIPVNIYCDVTNPLTGLNGSVRVFGPQKDNGKTDMKALEASFEKFAFFLSRESGKNVDDFPGAGAAGGTPAGLSAFLNVQVYQGAERILELCRFDEFLDKAEIVITGEGKLDNQSLEGKAPFIVAQKAHERSRKVIFVGGSIPVNADNEVNKYFDAIYSIVPGPVPLSDSIKNASEWLERTGYLIGKMLTLSA